MNRFAVSDKDPTASYKPRPLGLFPGWTWFRREHFSPTHVEAMMCDPQALLGFSMCTAPLYLGEWEIDGGSAAAEFADRTLRALWGHLRMILRYMAWGYGAVQPLCREERGYLRVDGLKDFHPLDARPLRHVDRGLWGVRIHNVTDEPEGVDLPLGNSIWLANDAHYGLFHGESVFKGAFWPWLAKVGKDGAEDICNMWFYKNAYRGEVVRFPVQNMKDANGVIRESKDVALAMVEVIKTGGLIALPNTRDEKGEYIWDVTMPQMNDAGTGLLAYLDKLDLRILRGLGLPDDVISQPDGGGTYGGRRVGWEAFLAIRQQDLVYLLNVLNKQFVEPLTRLHVNGDYQIVPKSLLESQAADVRGQPTYFPPPAQQQPQQQQLPAPSAPPNPFEGFDFAPPVQLGHRDAFADEPVVDAIDGADVGHVYYRTRRKLEERMQNSELVRLGYGPEEPPLPDERLTQLAEGVTAVALALKGTMDAQKDLAGAVESAMNAEDEAMPQPKRCIKRVVRNKNPESEFYGEIDEVVEEYVY